MRVPHRIVVGACLMRSMLPFVSSYCAYNSKSAGGSLTREPEQDRIDFLAQVRNLALEPLWRKVAGQEVHLDLSGSKKSAILSLKTGASLF